MTHKICTRCGKVHNALTNTTGMCFCGGNLRSATDREEYKIAGNRVKNSCNTCTVSVPHRTDELLR